MQPDNDFRQIISMYELLTPAQMNVADRMAIDSGVPGIELMEAAGSFLAEVVRDQFKETQRVLIVCGPGNNGGDGFVLARLLREKKRHVDLHVPLGTEGFSGDAKIAFERLHGNVQILKNPDWNSYDLIVDALFGAGLSKDVSGTLADLISNINAATASVLAVDLPSGINGETGAICGTAVRANATATFFRLKPGHLLLPGKSHCGVTRVGQIGIPHKVLDQIEPDTYHNVPGLWLKRFPVHRTSQHKYSRGHTLALSGPISKSGAARLMATAALRMGSGLVTLVAASDVLPVHASRLDSVMFTESNNLEELREILADSRINCIAMGPGLDPDETTREMVREVLISDRNTVLDAGALSAFAQDADILFRAARGRNQGLVFTPHSGEFAKLFGHSIELSSRTEMARKAASKTGAVVVLKGADTVVADSAGRAAITSNAPPWLATAGSGDVLTGMIAALLAQGMPAFEAACAAVWIHGEAANRLGPGLISSDLDQGVKEIVETHGLFTSQD